MSATAQSVAEPFRPRKLSKIGATGTLGNYPLDHSSDQAEVAKCLLADASFFQRADFSDNSRQTFGNCRPSLVSMGSLAVELRRLSTPLALVSVAIALDTAVAIALAATALASASIAIAMASVAIAKRDPTRGGF